MIYANDNDRDAAHWLRCLPLAIDTVDERSIKEVRGNDLTNYTQCHFFAGIGGWPLALKIAEWPDEIPVWTGSCPCQPFSQAGQRRGVADERHLWPEFRRLIDECRPTAIFGEQVASKAGREWLAIVRADLEALGYAVGAADLCAAGVGAPHIRQRLFWVAHSGHEHEGRGSMSIEAEGGRSLGEFAGCSVKRLGDTIEQSGCSSWADVEYIPCRDGKARPVKPGVRLLAHGIPGRVAQLRGLGNAIVPQVAATFVRCFMDFLEGESCEL